MKKILIIISFISLTSCSKKKCADCIKSITVKTNDTIISKSISDTYEICGEDQIENAGKVITFHDTVSGKDIVTTEYIYCINNN